MTDCYPMRKPRIASRVLDSEAIVMNPVDSMLFSLNSTATAIWQAADGRTSLRDIVARDIEAQFDVDPEAALRDAEEFVRALAEHSILTLSSQPQ